MSEPRAEVKNAADPKQVRRASQRTADQAELFRAALVLVMGTAPGRLALWELLTLAGVYGSVFAPDATIYYRAGRQDFGHELIALLLAADEGLYQTMETEARARARRDHASTDAAHTPAAAATEDGTDG